MKHRKWLIKKYGFPLLVLLLVCFLCACTMKNDMEAAFEEERECADVNTHKECLI